MELSPTGRVILGFLAAEPRSGYDIKRVVDTSTRFFWAASYGQIYPELKRLAAAGLIEAAGEATGGRRRMRYNITPAGEEALADWITSPDQLHEMRDEGLLKLFFAGLIDREAAIEVLQAKRAFHLEKLAALREIEPSARQAARPGPHQVLRYGVGMSEFAIEWCDQTIAELKDKREIGVRADA